METEHHAEFGDLLRRYRVAAGLSQEALAERAGVTAQAISALERGLRRTPYLSTVRLLAGALGLSEAERGALITASRRGSTALATAASLGTRDSRVEPAVLSVQGLHEPATPLVGRDTEVAAIATLLQQTEIRLLTLTGPGGVGKTRLALRVGETLRGHFSDGVVVVALGPISNPGHVVSTIAQALGVPEPGDWSSPESLIAALRDKRVLLTLDNFEHVTTAAPLVATLLDACPGLTALVTSRACLHLRDEHEFEVAPLAVPDTTVLSNLNAVAHSPAVTLFVLRARAARADFALTASNAHAVVEICRRLDGLPLALELAAPWVKLLAPAALLARLEHRLPLLTGGAWDLPSRHHTMRATIAWSYELLNAGEQALFRRLAVFVGGCTIDAAEAVVGEARREGMHDTVGPDAHAAALPPILDGLAGLVDKSLLRQAEWGAGEQRLTMLETVQEFGLECLVAAGETVDLRRRHAAYFLALAEEGEPQLHSVAQRAWLDRLEADHDNLRAALRWLYENGEAALGLRLAVALWLFWYTRGYFGEARGWLEEMLALADGGGQPISAPTRARALLWAGTFATEQGEYERALAFCAEGAALCRAVEDTWGEAWSFNVRGVIAYHHGDHAGAATSYEASLALYRRLHDHWGIILLLNNLGALARVQGDNEHAAALYEESLALARQTGDTARIALLLSNLAEIAHDGGDAGRAAALAESSLALFRALGDQRGIAVSLTYLGTLAREQGQHERARALYSESLTLLQQVGEQARIATALEGLAAVACALEDATYAARLLGAAAAVRQRIGTPVPLADQPDYDRTSAAVRAALGDAFLPARDVGHALPLDEVVNEVRAHHSAQHT